MSNSLVEFLIKLLLIESNKDRYKLAQKLLSSEMKNMLALNMQSIRHFAFSFGILPSCKVKCPNTYVQSCLLSIGELQVLLCIQLKKNVKCK